MPLTLGIETLGGIATPLVRRGTPLPAVRTQVFSTASDNQPAVDIRVVMGEGPIAEKNEAITKFTLKGIPPAPKGKAEIAVTFEVNEYCRVKAFAREKRSGTNIQVETQEVQPELAAEKVSELLKAAEVGREEDQSVLRRREARLRAEQLAHQAEQLLRQHHDDKLESTLAELGLALQDDDSQAIRACADRLEQRLQEPTGGFFPFTSPFDIFGRLAAKGTQGSQKPQKPQSDKSNQAASAGTKPGGKVSAGGGEPTASEERTSGEQLSPGSHHPEGTEKPQVDVVISWSGRQSKVVASALHAWLPSVLPGIKPWMSAKDIGKGREWFQELQDTLGRTRACIICVTPENVRSPWIYYEAGAIATKGPGVLVCPYLVGVSPSMLADGPLEKWQCTTADREDTLELIKSLNGDAFASRHDPSLLEGNFAARWPELAAKMKPVMEEDVRDKEGFVATDADRLAGANLSAEARAMILEVSKDPQGILSYSIDTGGVSFETHGVNLCPDQSARTVARWKAAMDNLVAQGVLEPRGYEGEEFALTAKGYDIVDALRGDASD